MFFKNKKKDIDTNNIKLEIMRWAEKQNVQLQMVEIQLGDFRDGPILSNIVSVFIFFKTDKDLKDNKVNGNVSRLEFLIKKMLENELVQGKQIDFTFDSYENVELNYNGSYLQYSLEKDINQHDF